ncbi:tail fiber domain-containing protein [candidate division KSB1 bacterium]|nr:tail fiber domain-containing protein [candidate division KSB1 bacterium]
MYRHDDVNGLGGGVFQIETDGDIWINGTLAHTSDVRWKKNIKTITSALDKVNQMRGVKFDWRQDEFRNKNFAEDTQIGFIAQELEKVVPEFVKTDDEGYKSVTYANVTALLVEAIKDQQNIIEQQRTAIDIVNAKIAELEMLVQKLSSRQVMSASAPVQPTKRENISLPRVQVQAPQVEEQIDENGRPVGSAQPQKEIKN